MLYKGNSFKQAWELHCAPGEWLTMGKRQSFGSSGSWHELIPHILLFSLFKLPLNVTILWTGIKNDDYTVVYYWKTREVFLYVLYMICVAFWTLLITSVVNAYEEPISPLVSQSDWSIEIFWHTFLNGQMQFSLISEKHHIFWNWKVLIWLFQNDLTQ